MRPRFSLYSKVLFLAFLNLCLLGAVFGVFVRMQFRMDAGSFLLAPAQNRIMALAHTLALELDETPAANWNALLERSAQANGVSLCLFDEDAERVAGPELKMPDEVSRRLQRQARPRGRPSAQALEQKKKGPGNRREGAPPLFLMATNEPTQYWAGVRVPLRQDKDDRPKPGTLILMSPSLVGSQLFFDPKPWLAVVLAVIVVSVACWLPFIRGMTRSISQMTNAAGQIAEGHFEVHAADGRRDEIGQLGDTINRMAAKLSGFVGGQKRFLGGIAHELCNPIATIQFALSNLERRVGEDQREAVADIQEEVQHMSALVNELLSFTKVGMQAVDVKLVPINVAGAVARAIEREATPGSEIVNQVAADLRAEADEELLVRAISNLIRNALRYAGKAGPITIAARAAAGRMYLTVSDCGPGVPEEALEEIFTPFYRVDSSRDETTGGVGLGLALVKSCVESCRGSVRCRNRKPSGLEVEIELEAYG